MASSPRPRDDSAPDCDAAPAAPISSDDEDDLIAFTTRQAAGAFVTVHRFVRPFLRNYRVGMVCIGVGLLVETLFNVIMPLSLKYLIDDALGQGDFQALYTILGVLAAAGLVTSIVAVWYERWDARTTAAVIADVRASMFERLQILPAAFYARTKRGTILSRFSVDMAAFEGAIKHAANAGLLPLFELIAGVGLMFWLNWQLAAAACLIFPITLIGPRILTPRAVAANYGQKVSEAATLGIVQEVVAGQMVVKAFGLQRRARRWFGVRNDNARRDMGAATFLSTMVERSVTISVLLLHLVILAVGAYLATKGRISIGTFVTFESAFWEVSYNISHLTHYLPVAIQAAAATRHIQELHDEPIHESDRHFDRSGAPDLPRGAQDIAFDHVSFFYESSDAPVLDDLDLEIEAGKHVAIVGSSGSGKSTLLKLILRLYAPTAGRVTIDGVDICEVTLDSVRDRMAVVFQENMLFNASILENIRLGNEGATDAEVIEAARKAEIHGYIMSLPDRYGTLVGERGDTLSGGQKQRIAIARALVRNPLVLLLDEATSALDQTTEAAITSTLLEVAKGRTLIFSTHRLTSVVQMDEIIVLDEGRVVERGSHAQLLAAGAAYASLWADPSQRSTSPAGTTSRIDAPPVATSIPSASGDSVRSPWSSGTGVRRVLGRSRGPAAEKA